MRGKDQRHIINNGKKTLRQSNMEIIRIIAMSMILIIHFIGHTSLIHIVPSVRYIIPFVVEGVDLFILLSGYFLIKLNWKSVLWLILLIWAFQSFIFLSLYFSDNISDISYKTILGTYLNPFTNNEYWFIRNYFMLMLVSPLINLALKNITNERYIYILSALTIIEIYAFWIMQLYNKDTGTSLYNFIYLYIVGHSLYKFDIPKRYTSRQIIAIGSFSLLINLFVNAFTLWYFQGDFGSYMNSYTYNYCNPFTIATCICIILLFSKYEFYSSKINSLASASLGAYLLQDGLLGTRIIYGYQSDILGKSTQDFLFATFLIFVSYWVISWIITFCTRTLLYPHITKFLDRFLPKSCKFDFID